MAPRKKGHTGGVTSAANAQKRVRRELAEFNRSAADRLIFHIESVNGSLQHLQGHINGPQDSPFEGGKFKVDIVIPDTYPFTPPKFKFTTRLWHPNISSVTGTICLDILKDQWAGSLSLRTVMLSLQALMCSPEPDDPQDAVVARQYKEMNEMYKKTAKYWTYKFAIEQKTPELGQYFSQYNDIVSRLAKEARVTDDQALHALSCANWDYEAAKK